MIGNVWEWVNSIYTLYPYDFNDGREAGSDALDNYRILRGGAWDTKVPDLLTATFRNNNTPDYENICDGFRCAQDI
jgi:formylglycine-generating enzyme required for sulfatase activity